MGFLLRNFEVTSLIKFRQPTVHRYSQRNTVVSSREDAPYPFSQPLHEHHLRSASLCSGTTPSSNCTSMIDVPCEGYIISPDSTGRRRGRTAIQRVKCPVLTLELSTTARMLPALRSIVPRVVGKRDRGRSAEPDDVSARSSALDPRKRQRERDPLVRCWTMQGRVQVGGKVAVASALRRSQSRPQRSERARIRRNRSEEHTSELQSQ